MILINDFPNKFFRLNKFFIPNHCKEKIIHCSSNYKKWPAYGLKNKELYIASPTIKDIKELELVLNLINPKIRDDVKFNIMAINPGCTIAAHTDPDRYCAINIPIAGNYRTSYLQFFEQGNSKKIVTDFIKPDGTKPEPAGVNYPNPKLIGRVYYDTPICINTNEIHNVKNVSKESRIVLSMGFETIKFKVLEKIHKENTLLV